MYQMILVPRAGTFSTMIRGSWNAKWSVQMSSLSLAVSWGTISRSLYPVRDWARSTDGAASAPRPDTRNERRDTMAGSVGESWLAVRMTPLDDSRPGKVMQAILPGPEVSRGGPGCPVGRFCGFW